MTEKRNIFQEVSGTQSRHTQSGHLLAGGMIAAADVPRGPARSWLILIFVLVAAMIVVGGLTRLTDSGLSITEWRPVTGALPPMGDGAWQIEVDKYRATPEYQLQNKGMGLDAFKTIYWWEWGHRQLGRTTGFVWAAGFALLWAFGRTPTGWGRRFWLLGLLGGVQGAIGWWMVSSGLGGERVDVASYRLATHLGLAFAILGLIVWYVLCLGRSDVALIQARRAGDPRLFSLSTGLMHLAFLQILVGAFVAGIDAGRAFPTWPDMNGQFFPADAFYVPDGAGGSLPLWHAFFENAGLVQFMHRMIGYALFAFGLAVWLRARRSPHAATRTTFNLMMFMLAIQVALGIGAALSAAELYGAISHQLGAIIVWVLIVSGRFWAQYPKMISVRGGAI